MTKSKGKHPSKALSAVRVRTIREPGRYADGNGLYLIVDPSGAKRWMLRTVIQGRRRDIGLGGISIVSLAEAREEAMTIRKKARAGEDPLAERKTMRKVIPNFESAARKVHSEHSATWKNKKHAAQWINTLSAYVFPDLGNRSIDSIDTSDVLSVLSPIWLTKPETARRVKQRMGVVFDWAKASGYYAGENPVMSVVKGLPRQPANKSHLAALPFDKLPGFVDALRSSTDGIPTKLAFEFLILTATRTSEVLKAKWSEIDFEHDIWVVPADRMKAGRDHTVPLSPRCLEILQAVKDTGDGEYIFPGRTEGKPISNMAFLMLLRRMKIDVTAHGFRSTFRDWASEKTYFSSDVCEMALAHTIKNKTEAAYRRGDLLEKRRELMNTWEAFADGRTQ